MARVVGLSEPSRLAWLAGTEAAAASLRSTGYGSVACLVYIGHSYDLTHWLVAPLATFTKPSRHSQPTEQAEMQFVGGRSMFWQVFGQRDMQPLKVE